MGITNKFFSSESDEKLMDANRLQSKRFEEKEEKQQQKIDRSTGKCYHTTEHVEILEGLRKSLEAPTLCCSVM